jgi:hypothetical protein
MENFLIEARKLAYSETEKYGIPAIPLIDLATSVGKRIAKELNTNIDIVEAGTLLMDCALGQALKENRGSEHVQLSLDKANKLINESSLSSEEKENILHCIQEHHGSNKFYSLESEICCNADCYRFISIEGFILSIKYGREMSFEDLVILLKNKVNEKWNALSLDISKKELASQYESVIELLKNLK